MNWKKAKTILIWVFIFVNIFLIVMYNMNYNAQKQYNKTDIISILANNKITIDEKNIKNQDRSVESFEVNNFIADKDFLAKAFLGDGFTKVTEETFTRDSKKLSVYDIAFEYSNESPSDKNFSKLSELNASNKIMNAISEFGFNKEHLSVIDISKKSDGTYVALVNYNFLKMPLFRNYIHVTANEKGILKISGSYLTLTQNNKFTHNVLSCEEILVEFTSNPDLRILTDTVKITEVHLGYFLSNEIVRTTDAIPCYEISLDNGKVYYYDARNNVSREYRFLDSITDINKQFK